MAEGVTALFGEKYGELVRVVRMGGFSAELCGGTHVARTGQIGAFAILSEGSVAAGIRRIEAVTGLQAQQLAQQQRRALEQVRDLLGSRGSDEVEKLEKSLAEKKELQRELKRLRERLTLLELEQERLRAPEIGGVRVLARRGRGEEMESLKEQAELLQQGRTGLAALLVSESEGRVVLALSLSADLVAAGRHAGNLLKGLLPHIDGKGGGRPNLATAGGKDATGVAAMIEAFTAVWRGAERP
jgi:alanyl-tRNA synthetase